MLVVRPSNQPSKCLHFYEHLVSTNLHHAQQLQRQVQAGVFDTAFHHTMPPVAYMYALPYELYEEQGVRRFGAHGTSYRYLTSQVAKHYGKPAEELDLIIMHLGVASTLAWLSHASRDLV